MSNTEVHKCLLQQNLKNPPIQEWKTPRKSDHKTAQCFASGNICTHSTLSFHKYILVNSTLTIGNYSLENCDDNELSKEDSVSASVDQCRESHRKRNCDDPRQRNVSHQ